MDASHPPHRHSRHRSRSPYRHDRDVNRHRSRSPDRKHHHSRGHADPPPPVKLPYKRPPLDKRAFETYKPLFAEYLDVQKRLDIAALSEHEVRGRWKSFVARWNRRELAEGWYDPEMKSRADERWALRPMEEDIDDHSPKAMGVNQVRTRVNNGEDDDDDDDDEDAGSGYGPSLPSTSASSKPPRPAGPSIPRLDDLQHRRELAEQDRAALGAEQRLARKADRALQKARLEELAPRADAGSRERQLEKKREVAAANRAFRDAGEAGEAEVGEGELMGGGEEDGIEGFRREQRKREKAKNERELRKEEILRARAVEREDRMRVARAKEDKTMDLLKGIARERFG